jgi:hypothetical protein
MDAARRAKPGNNASCCRASSVPLNLQTMGKSAKTTAFLILRPHLEPSLFAD